MTFNFGIVGLVLIVWILLGMGQRGIMGLWISLGAKKRRSVDASHLSIAPPPETRANIEALFSLGFTRVGEAQVKLPLRPPVTAWVFTDPENTIQAEAGWNRVSFSSFFRENVLVVTDYPSGEHIEQPTYFSHTVPTSVEEAYQHHLKLVARFRQQYGLPHPIRSMTDYLRWETMGRVHYGTRKMRRFIVMDVIRLVACLSGCLVIGGLALLMIPAVQDFLLGGAALRRERLLFMMVLCALPAFIAPELFNIILLSQTRRNSAKR